MKMARKENYDYFKSFIYFADCIERATAQLNDTLNNYDSNLNSQRMDEIHKVEHEADDIKHHTTDALAKEFLPPIERDDIVLLAGKLDDVVDAIDDIMRRLCMYDIKTLRPETADFSELLVECCSALSVLIKEFSNFKKSKKVTEYLSNVNSLESKGDSLHFKAVSKLFAESKDALEIIMWKSIYDDFEDCYNSFEDVADVIGDVVLKNS